MSTDPESRRDFGPYLEGVGPTYVDNGEVKYIRYGVIEDLRRALELHGENVAAFLVEPSPAHISWPFTGMSYERQLLAPIVLIATHFSI